MQARQFLGSTLVRRRHTALLLTIVALFAVRPFFGDVGAAAMIFSITILAVVFAALLTTYVEDLVGERDLLVAQRRRRIYIGWVLAVPAIAERLWMYFSPNAELLLLGAISWLAFFTYVTWIQFRILLKQRAVTGETISMSISVYLLLGLCWTLLYIVIHMQQPQSFNLGASAGGGELHVFPVFIYFSLTTLSTVGFGDITPVSLLARYAAVAEAITGQFYLAILVARLVGMHMSAAAVTAPGDAVRDGRSVQAAPKP